MAETLFNKNQAGDGIYTQDNLVGGDNISIVREQQKAKYVVSGFLSNACVDVPGSKFVVPSGAPFELCILAKTPASTYGNRVNILFGGKSSYYAGGLSSECEYYNNHWKFKIYVTNNGSSWQINKTTDAIFEPDAWYYFKYSGISGDRNFYMHYSTDGEAWTQCAFQQYYANITVYQAENYVFQFGTANSDNRFWGGSIDMRGCWAKVNNIYTFNGATAIPGTDFTFENESSLTIETAQAGDVEYKVNTDFTNVSGYSSSGTQVLKNIDGVLTWVTEA